MANCIIYPNKLIRSSDDGCSWFKLIKEDIVVIVYEYLYNSYCSRDGTYRFSLEHMIVNCGYKVNFNKGKSLDKFKFVLNKFSELGILDINTDINKVKLNDFIIANTILNVKNNFFMVDNDSKDVIMNCKENKSNRIKLYNYYCYICSRIYNGDGEIIGGKYNNCFYKIDKVTDDLGYSSSTIIKFNNILKELGLIDFGNIGKMIKGKDIINGTNYYVLTKMHSKGKYIEYNYKYHLEEGLKFSEKYYRDLGYKKYKIN